MVEIIAFVVLIIVAFWLGSKYGTFGKVWAQGWPDLLAWVHLKKKSAEDEIERAKQKLAEAERNLRAKRDKFGTGSTDDTTPPAPPSV